MASNIDATKPIMGAPTTESVREQFAIARDEITALQAALEGLQAPGGGGAPSSPFRYVRLRVNANPAGNIAVMRLRLLNGTTVNPPFPMTAANAPSPYVITTSDQETGWDGWKAFTDFPDNDGWLVSPPSAPEWLTIDSGVGNSMVFRQVEITPASAATAPPDFDLLGSATGAFAGEETLLLHAAPGAVGWANGVARLFGTPF
jgi:hypothetical protein